MATISHALKFLPSGPNKQIEIKPMKIKKIQVNFHLVNVLLIRPVYTEDTLLLNCWKKQMKFK